MDIKERVEELEREPIPGEYGHPIPRELMLREMGFNGPYSRHYIGKRVISTSFATKAVHRVCTKELHKRRFKLPSGARTTFHMGFSADGSKVASCHGDHNVYVCDVASGEVLQALNGHPRTPWCVVFHPTQNDILASGCLAGQVRVWDLNGGSEKLVTDSGTVIASLAFHPTVRLLAIATFNEIIFWDWSLPYPMARCSTENTKEKVRLVRFDRLGTSLITGITNFPNPPYREGLSRARRSSSLYRPNILRSAHHRYLHPNSAGGDAGPPSPPPYVPRRRENNNDDRNGGAGDDPDDGSGPGPDPGSDREVAALAASIVAAADDDSSVTDALSDRQDRFQESYRQLVNHYQDLVTHYQQFLRSRIPRLLETSRSTRAQQLEAEVMTMPDPTGGIIIPTLEAFVSGADDDVNSMTSSMEVVPDDLQAVPTITLTDADSAEMLEGEIQVGTPIVIDDEIPGPSRLMQLEASLLAQMSQGTSAPMDTIDASVVTESDESTEDLPSVQIPTASSNTSERRDTDLRSIEALAQNILEMQNLCSQARRDAPLTIETQHIIELQNIRRHLEVLQEQTRDLQSSIRATLSSLASGSLAALRSHLPGSALSTGGNTSSSTEPETPPTPSDQDSEREPNESETASVADFLETLRGSGVAPTDPLSGSTAVPPNADESSDENDSRSRNSPTHGGAGTYYRITIGPGPPYAPEMGRVSPPIIANPNMLNRIRVPPMVTMQYDIQDGYYRARPTLNPSRGASDEPVPGTSRNLLGRSSTPTTTANRAATNTNGAAANSIHVNLNPFQEANAAPSGPGPGPRRIVREFHVVGRGENEHSRNCPFSGRDTNLIRPPPRMRCLAEMGDPPALTVWPTIETGYEVATRNFRNSGVEIVNNLAGNSSITSRSNIFSGVHSGPFNIAESAFYHNGNGFHSTNNHQNFNPFNPMNYWIQGGYQMMVPNDIRVGIFLTLRQGNQNGGNVPGNEDGRNNIALSTEGWQQMFQSGLALVPPGVRQGSRQLRRRRQPGRCPINNSSATSRSLQARAQHWIDYLYQLPHVPATLGDGATGGPVIMPTRLEVPGRLNGNFVRIFYMRMGEEFVPVYSHLAGSTEPAGNSELREGVQANVYLFPIGLFLHGAAWQGNTQTIGIYWPPGSRDEEETLSEFRRNESLVPVFPDGFRTSNVALATPAGVNIQNARFRVEFDSVSLRILIPRGVFLNFIHPGLTILDAVTTAANFPRPRASEGVLYIDYISPFLDALERIFGHRARRISPAHLLGASGRVSTALGTGFLSRTSPWMQGIIGRNHGPGHSANRNNNNNNNAGGQTANPQQPEAGTNGEATAAATNASAPQPSSSGYQYAGTLMTNVDNSRMRANPRRIITFANDAPSYRGTPEDTDEPAAVRRRYDPEIVEGREFNGEIVSERIRNFYINQSNRLRNEFFHGPPDADGNIELPDHSRRVIRLAAAAVDTAAAELMRRQQIENHLSHIAHMPALSSPALMSRAIESRIERVLNERGNRGVSLSPPITTNSTGTGSIPETPAEPTATTSSMNTQLTGTNNPGRINSSSSDEVPEDPRRLGEFRRMAMLAQMQRNARASYATSGTQTTQSFLNEGGSSPELPAPNGSARTRSPERNLLPPNVTTTTAAPTARPDVIPVRGTRFSPDFPILSSTGSGRRHRRHYSRVIAASQGAPANPPNNSDDDIAPPLPPRTARLSSGGASEHYGRVNYSGRESRLDREIYMNQEVGRMASLVPYGEHLVIRRQRVLARLSHADRARITEHIPMMPYVQINQNLNEMPGSARTRATTSHNSQSTPSTSNNPTIPTVISGSEESRPLPSIANHPLIPGRNPFRPINPGGGVLQDDPTGPPEPGARFYPGYIPEILITPRARPPTYYTMDAATTAFLSSRIQKWDFSKFILPDITKRDESVVVRECSLHSDACLDLSNDSTFVAVLQPSDNGSYSAVGVYSLKSENLGEVLYVFHFDQNTVSVSISPSCDYIVVGYAGRGPLYRFVHPSRNIGQILSLSRYEEDKVKLVAVKELFADSQSTLMSVNCMHWVPIPGYGIIYGTNTGELVLLS